MVIRARTVPNALKASLIVAFALYAGVAEAQEADATGSETSSVEPAAASTRAAELRASAATAFGERRLADAERLLREALELEETPSTVFNLGRVLLDMGRPVEAAALFHDLEQGAYGELNADRTNAVNVRLQAAELAIARLTIVGEGPGEARVRVDGEDAGTLTAASPLERRVDPGDHRVVVATSLGDDAVNVRLSPGDSEALRFSLPPPVPAANGRRLIASPWLWIVVGAVLVGGAVATGVLVRRSQPDVVSDPIFGNVSAVSALR
ncbi:MAG: hypothetical protein AAF938_11050 [Myxococcota bacterium]